LAVDRDQVIRLGRDELGGDEWFLPCLEPLSRLIEELQAV